jgi:hypothetical protein
MLMQEYELLLCNKLKTHGTSDASLRCTSSTANCDLISLVSNVALFDLSVSFSPLEFSLVLHTHIDLPDEADHAQRNR